MLYTQGPKSVVLVMSNQNRDMGRNRAECQMEYRGDIGRLQVRSQEKGWRVGIEDAGMMNASVACREEDGGKR